MSREHLEKILRGQRPDTFGGDRAASLEEILSSRYFGGESIRSRLVDTTIPMVKASFSQVMTDMGISSYSVGMVPKAESENMHIVGAIDFLLKFNPSMPDNLDQRFGYMQVRLHYSPNYHEFGTTGLVLSPWKQVPTGMVIDTVMKYADEIEDREGFQSKTWVSVTPYEFLTTGISRGRDYSYEEVKERVTTLIRIAAVVPERVPPKF